MSAATATRTLRALSAFIGRRTLRAAGGIALIIMLLLFAGIWLLAAQVSGWWWILALPLSVASFVLFVLYSLLRFLLLRLYPKQFTKEQTHALKGFVEKLTQLNDARATSPFMFVTVTLWELVRYREIRTLRALISNSSSLKPDFERLTRFF
ncbi:MAG: hypothetical protein ACTJG2_03175 [Candidatus Saccharimonadales bacterium]